MWAQPFQPCLKIVKMALFRLYPKHVSGSVQVLKTADKVNKSDYFKNASKHLKNTFVLGANEYLERLEGNIRRCSFFYVKIF